ncbi:MAG: hypothetical protein JSU07_06230 [Bacteroidetes bacterium]|nr:hypothetical protein [Bacteroidota bacterium]
MFFFSIGQNVLPATIYNVTDSTDFRFSNITDDSLNNIYVTVNSGKSNPQYSVTIVNSKIIKINHLGNYITTYSFVPNFQIVNIIKSNNNYYVFGHKINLYSSNTAVYVTTIIKIDLNFNIQAIKSLDTATHTTTNFLYYACKLIKLNDALYSFSQININQAKIFKLDFNLNKLDSTFISVYAIIDACPINNKLYLSYLNPTQSSLLANGWISVLDTTFNVQKNETV